MRKSLALFLAAGVWQLIRFTSIFLTSAAAPNTVANAHLNIIWIAAPSLVLAALLFASSFFPVRIPAYLPILRIGGALAALSDAVVMISGSYDWSITAETPVISGRALFGIAFAILVVDLIVAALLIAYRPAPNPTDTLPDYNPKDVDHPG